MHYDLEERTLKFSKNVLALCKKISLSPLNRSYVDQLLRSSSSIGANYREANGACSRKDFSNKIHICKKEAKETFYWLNLLAETDQTTKVKVALLLIESEELLKIFSKIANSSKF